MNRLGWTILALIVLLGAGFALIVRTGGYVFTGAAPVATPVGSGLLIPVAGVRAGQLTDTWGQSRGAGMREHHAIDIMAPRGTPVLAAAPGKVEKIFESANGGHTLYVRSGDGGTVYYYAHLDAYDADVHEGLTVAQGQRIATVGSTGDADPSAPHLHFEIKRMRPGESWWQGTDVNPYPLLAGKQPAS